MIETIVKNFIRSRGVTAYLELPEDFPEHPRFALVEKVGGGYGEGLSRATVAVQTYGGSLAETAALNQTVKGILLALPELDAVTRCELNSDYNYTDLAHKRQRYQAVYDITYYEEATT